MAKTTPYPPCTVTVFWPTGTDLWRCCRRVTPTKLYRRAVSCKANLHRIRSIPGLCQRARKSFEAPPCNRPVASKHMLFCQPGLRHQTNFSIQDKSCLRAGTLASRDNFIIPWLTLSVCRDFGI